MSEKNNFWEQLEKEMGIGSTNDAGKTMDFSPLDLEDSNDVELRTVFVYLVYDVSGSMQPYSDTMYDSFDQTCGALSANENEDYNYKVKLVTFDEKVHEINKQFQNPADLRVLISKDTFACDGRTSISKLINYLDDQFSRVNLKGRGLHRGDPSSIVVIVTDYEATEEASTVKAATDAILTNRFYNYANKTICLYCGEDKHKADAAELAGGLDNVVSLGKGNIKELLIPVTIASTITLSDATHIGGEITTKKTPGQIVSDIVESQKTANKSAGEMSSTEIRDELIRILGKG